MQADSSMARRHRHGRMSAIAAGALGGLVGTLAMSEAQRLWTRAVDSRVPDSASGAHDARDWQERSEDQNANEIAAQAVAKVVAHRRLTRDELAVAAAIFHYAFGAAAGACYAACTDGAERYPASSGIAFGTSLWLLADELAMPALGLSARTERRPVEMHLQSLFAHLVYGIVAERTRALAMRATAEA